MLHCEAEDSSPRAGRWYESGLRQAQPGRIWFLEGIFRMDRWTFQLRAHPGRGAVAMRPDRHPYLVGVALGQRVSLGRTVQEGAGVSVEVRVAVGPGV